MGRVETQAARQSVGGAAPVAAGPITLSACALALVPFALLTDYRPRFGISFLVAELFAYAAMGVILVDPRAIRTPRAFPSLAAAFVALIAMLMARSLYFRIDRFADIESAATRIRDAGVPLALVLLVYWRLRLRGRGASLVVWAVVVAGALAGAIGVSQFFRGTPFLVEGAESLRYKTQVAQKYWLAELLHYHIEYLARGFYGFSINYATSQIVPCVLAFSLTLRGSWRRRLVAAACFVMAFAGVYLSFARTSIYLIPVGCALAALATFGRLRPVAAFGLALAYLVFAWAGPLMHRTIIEDADTATLDSRVQTVLDFIHHVGRDPSLLWLGSPLNFWHEWNSESLSPHNFIANAVLSDGLPATVLRIGLYAGLCVVLFPSSRGRPALPERAGLWGGAFTLLFIAGETEPYGGIPSWLAGSLGLAVLAALAPDEEPPPHLEVVRTPEATAS